MIFWKKLYKKDLSKWSNLKKKQTNLRRNVSSQNKSFKNQNQQLKSNKKRFKKWKKKIKILKKIWLIKTRSYKNYSNLKIMRLQLKNKKN